VATPGRARVIRGSEAAAAGAAALASDLAPTSAGGFTGMVDRNLVEKVKAEARQEGFATGYAEGLDKAQHAADAAHAEAERRIRQACAALLTAAGALAERQAIGLSDMEDEIAEIAFELATALVGHELAAAEAPGRDAVARAISLAPAKAAITVRLHPDDVAVIGDPDQLAPGRDLTIIPDPRVEPGGCIADAGGSHIDAQLSTATERVRQALLEGR
jgi:flagellar assembly protein FliH